MFYRVFHSSSRRLSPKNITPTKKFQSKNFFLQVNHCHLRNYSNQTLNQGQGPKGFLTLDELSKFSKSGAIDTVIMGFTDHCGRLYGKRMDVDFFLGNAFSHGTHACEYLLTVDIQQHIIEGFEFSNWSTGFGDFHLVPDLKTLRYAAWLDRSAFITCDLHHNKTHEHIPIAPRSILKKQVDRAQQMGLHAMGATELEYFMYRTSYEEANKLGYDETKLEHFGYVLGDYNLLQSQREEVLTAQIRRHLKNSGIKVESSKGEYGFGQHELNIEYSDLVTMGDNHVVFKQCFKETAQQMGLSVTFMAKPHTSQSGSSCHVHMSLWDESLKNNLFRGDENLDGLLCSPTFKHFLGGWLKYAPEIMVFMAPTINSYKRFRAGSWAPTKCGWSLDNRTAGFRIIGEGSNGLRIECRIPGADCNPYLVMGSLLAAGLEGIEKKIQPPPKIIGDMYSNKKVPAVPTTLRHAVDLFDKSKFARSTLGENVVNHYSHFYRKEVASFDSFVTDWERKRYFEQI